MSNEPPEDEAPPSSPGPDERPGASGDLGPAGVCGSPGRSGPEQTGHSEQAAPSAAVPSRHDAPFPPAGPAARSGTAADPGQPERPAPPAQPGPHPWPYGHPPGQPYAGPGAGPYGAPAPGGHAGPGPAGYHGPAAGPYGGPPPGPYGWAPAPPPHPGQRYVYYGPPAPVDPTLAEWWQRLVARIVDTVVLAVLMAPLTGWFFVWYLHRLPAMFPADPATPPRIDDIMRMELRLMGVSLLVGLAGALVLFAYDGLQHAKWGQTLGKRAMKIKVVELTTRGPITGGAAAKRAAMYAFAPEVPGVGGIVGLLNVLWLLWDKPYRQCLHDKVARTVVVKTEAPGAGWPPG